MKKNKTLLVVAAHPDDEILGCAGTVAKLIKQGYTAYSLVLGEGVTSRDLTRNAKSRKIDLNDLQAHMQKANDTLGIKKLFFHQFPDNRFDSVALLDLVKPIETIFDQIQPEIIFTHFANDLNVDHQMTFKAVITATRPLPENVVKTIYAFETLSSTEYNYPLSFTPDTFVDISSELEIKMSAMSCYQGELREYPHPRSLEMIKLNAEYWGVRTGMKYVEAFKTIRHIC